jgi:RNA polymerase sigma-70 factor (ECF subfamily)
MAAERLKLKLGEMHENTHAGLVKDCLAGDRKAQYRLYRLYNKAMYNTCLRMLRNREDAEDVLQNSFIDVFTKLSMFRGDSTIGAWIKRIVVNNCINFIKKKRLPLTDMEQTKLPEVDEGDDTEDNLQLDVAKINDALYQLPDGYRIVFSLYAIEGYDHNEIAAILETSVSTSKSQYSRARKRLKGILRDRQQVTIN